MRCLSRAMLGLAAAVVTVTGAAAADLPPVVKAPVLKAPVVVPFNWSGGYGGLNVGYGWGGSGDASTVSCADPAFTGFCTYIASGGFPPIGLSQKGFIGGGQIGYNWQPGNVVWGIEADLQASGIKDSATQTVTPPLAVTGITTQDHKLLGFGTLRGRLGIPVNNWLFYGTAGLIVGDVSSSLTLSAPTIAFVATGSHTGLRAGWTVGLGTEMAFAGRWSAKLEYLYYDLGSDNVTATSSSPGFVGDTTTISQKTTGHIIRTGLNYRF